MKKFKYFVRDFQIALRIKIREVFEIFLAKITCSNRIKDI